ncbi:alpha/beta-hydrolase [Meredithblackwellia eburnea MCA 4105]
MPYIHIPERGLKMFYVVNATVPLKSMLDDTPPESGVLDPDKPNVVFIHAGASSLASFTSQFSDKRLTNAFNLIALDARLCGRTEGTPRERHVIEDSSYCLTYALDELGLEKYSLVGEEFHGCNCATWIAIKRPERVQSLLLASPGWLKEPQATINAMLNEFLPGAISNKNGNGDGSGTIPDETMQIVSDYYFGKLGREPEVRTYLKYALLHLQSVLTYREDSLKQRRDLFLKVYQKRYGTSQSAHDVNHVVNMFNRDPIPPELMATVKAPVLILQGADDAVAAPLQAAEEWQALFTNGELFNRPLPRLIALIQH